MAFIKNKKKVFTIFCLLFGISLLVITVSVYFFLIPWAKAKVIAYVEEHTEYRLRINSITLTGFHRLEITGIEIRPKLDIKEFNKKISLKRDWISLKAENVSLVGIHWTALLWHEKACIDTIQLLEADLYVLRDKRMMDPPLKIKPLPGHYLRNTPFSFTFPIVKLMKGNITYHEIEEEGVSFQVVFSKLYASLYHLSSDSSYRAAQPEVVLDGIGWIMDSIEANMQYKFYPLDKNDRFTYEGHTGPFSANLLNTIIKPLRRNYLVKSGAVESVSLFFQGNNFQANGEMDMEYKDLKLNLLSKKRSNRIAFFKTQVGKLLIRKNKINEVGKIRETSPIACERDQDKSIYCFWWKAIRSGIVSTIIKIPISPKKK